MIVAVLVPSNILFAAEAEAIVKSFAVILAVNPDGNDTVYLVASAPPKVWVEVTTIPFPTVVAEKLPVPEMVTTSEPTTPTKVDPEIVAVVVLSYILLSAEALVTVKFFGEMVYTKMAFPVPPSLVAEIFTLKTPVTAGVPVISPLAIFIDNPAGNPEAL